MGGHGFAPRPIYHMMRGNTTSDRILFNRVNNAILATVNDGSYPSLRAKTLMHGRQCQESEIIAGQSDESSRIGVKEMSFAFWVFLFCGVISIALTLVQRYILNKGRPLMFAAKEVQKKTRFETGRRSGTPRQARISGACCCGRRKPQSSAGG